MEDWGDRLEKAKLLKLKINGKRTHKKWHENANANTVEIGEWLLSYVIENGQKVLAISRLDKKSFEADKPSKEIPHLSEIFLSTKKIKLITINTFPMRGYTVMLTL